MSKAFAITKEEAKKIAAKSAKRPTTSPVYLTDDWFDSELFTANPDKIAGIMSLEWNRKRWQQVTRGTEEDIRNAIKVTSGKIDNWMVSPSEPFQVEVTKFDRIQAALQATDRLEQNPPPTEGYELLSFDDIRNRYNSEISDDEYRIWANYQKGRMFDTLVVDRTSNAWSQFTERITEEEYISFFDKDLVAFNGNSWVPAVIYYYGAIYETITKTKQNQSAIVSKIGENRYDIQLKRLHKSIPQNLKLTAPKDERLVIKLLDPFAQKFEVESLSTGRIFDEAIDVIEAFKSWIDDLPREAFKNGSSAYNIMYHYITHDNFARDTPEETKIDVKRKAQIDGESLFSTFLSEIITQEDQKKIEYTWNAEYNGWREFDYTHIPVGFEISKWFGTGEIDPQPALWDGVRFMQTAGSGLIAFDVGVGKTMESILGLAQGMYTGQCKRPVVCVPKGVYKKFMEECVGGYNADGTVRFHGILPQFKDRINDYGNLRGKYLQKMIDNPPRDYTITFITFEALSQVGMSKNFMDRMAVKLFLMLDQSTTAREMQQSREDVDVWIGEMAAETVVNADELGWDYLVLDEAHNMKNLVTEVKGRENEDSGSRDNKTYNMSQGGKPTKRAMKTFMLSHYIQENNNGRNVCLLTATPFSNSALEIYSMLSFIAMDKLKQRGITNIIDFFDKFVQEATEWVVGPSNTLKIDTVIRNYDNRVVLQNLIFSCMLHKTGEEANVPRPIKVEYPRVRDEDGLLLPELDQVDTKLRPTKDQAYWFDQIAAMAVDGKSGIAADLPHHYFDDRSKQVKAKVLYAVTLGRLNVISPYLMTYKNADKTVEYFVGDGKPTMQEFFASSPKLSYVLGCIKTIKQWHDARNEPMSGVVLYMDFATDWHKKIVLYIAEAIGLQPNQVATISGGGDNKPKENIKDKFNSGEIKLLMGSSAIREGIDLQKKASTMFEVSLPWKPTERQQLHGRIYRRGNPHSHVRIVAPLMENSVDMFMFQKLDEKTSRINNIWFKAGRKNVLDTDQNDPMEMKMSLMTSPKQKAEVDIQQTTTKVEMRQNVMKDQLSALKDAEETIIKFNGERERINLWYQEAKEALKLELERVKLVLKDKTYADPSEKGKLERRLERIPILFAHDKDENRPKCQYAIIKYHARYFGKTAGGGINYAVQERSSEVDRQIKRMEGLDRLQKNVLNQHSLIITDDLKPLIGSYTKDLEKVEKDLEALKDPETLKTKTAEYAEEMEKNRTKSETVEGRVKQFTRHNYLLSCLKDVHDCDVDSSIIRKSTKVIQIDAKPKLKAPIGVKIGKDAGKEKARIRAKAFAYAQAQRLRLMKLDIAA